MNGIKRINKIKFSIVLIGIPIIKINNEKILNLWNSLLLIKFIFYGLSLIKQCNKLNSVTFKSNKRCPKYTS